MIWVLWVITVLLALRWRKGAQKGLILSLLLKNGEQSGMQLRDAGVGTLVYNRLRELEEEGLVESRSDDSPLSTLARGGRTRWMYRVRLPAGRETAP